MSQISISVQGLHPYPTLVVALRRITSGSIGAIAGALAQGTPLLTAELGPPSFSAIRDLLALLRVAAVQPLITEDARTIDEQALLSVIENWELALAQPRSVANGAELA